MYKKHLAYIGTRQQKIQHSKTMDENGFTRMFHFFIRTPPPLPPPTIIKDDVFSNRIFYLKKATNFDAFGKIFKDAYKERTLRFSLFIGRRQKFEGSYSSHPWRDGSAVRIQNGTSLTHPLINLQHRHLDYI